MNTKRAGIDPGKTGGIAIFEGEHLTYGRRLDTVTPQGLYHILTGCTEIVIERAQATRQMGASNSFEYGRSFGLQETVANLTGAKIFYVAPQWWKGRLNIPTDKKRATQIALKGIPNLEQFIKAEADHGIAEAALMATLLLSEKYYQELVLNNSKREQPKKRVSYRL